MPDSKVIIVANRLPVRVQLRKTEWKLTDSEGGLATGLSSIYKHGNNIWIGWPGAVISKTRFQNEITEKLLQKRLKPIWLTQNEIRHFYEGFSNETLWPLFHYFSSFAKFKADDWRIYKEVNRRFAEEVLRFANDGDTVWVHDYQLLLVPEMVRRERPNLSIGFFQHIPFPSYELFRMLPWRKELLYGILGADLIGFHTFDDERHFLSSIKRILNIATKGNEIFLDDRTVAVDAFPIGIDYKRFRDAASEAKTRSLQAQISNMTGGKKLMLSIDRLDYSKGILNRLYAYMDFLRRYPEYKEKIVFFQLIVPSRDKVQQYSELKEEINSLVSEINAQFGTLIWQPIYYFYRSYPLEMISALYSSADIALVAPLRDGMNLVCKEYVASRLEQDGVLILSEMAGASKELKEAILVNPRDISQVADAIREALEMDSAEKRRRMESMQQIVARFDIYHWVNNFMRQLQEVKARQSKMTARLLPPSKAAEIVRQFAGSATRLLLLDYDGTLVPFNSDPLKASPDEPLKMLLRSLAQDPATKVVLISGRDRRTLEEWFGEEPIDLIAEHGLWKKRKGADWQTTVELSSEWKKTVRPILERSEMLTPGSFIEEKSYSLAWHYRKVDSGLGERRAEEMNDILNSVLPGFELQVLRGHKVLEIKSMYINKGKAAFEFVREYNPDFILAVGDDVTDEDTFKAMPAHAYSLKVGKEPSAAAFNVRNIQDVRNLLDKLKADVGG